MVAQQRRPCNAGASIADAWCLGQAARLPAPVRKRCSAFGCETRDLDRGGDADLIVRPAGHPEIRLHRPQRTDMVPRRGAKLKRRHTERADLC